MFWIVSPTRSHSGKWLYLLPDEDVVDDGGATEDDAEADDDRRDDRRRWVEVKEGVQNDAWNTSEGTIRSSALLVTSSHSTSN